MLKVSRDSFLGKVGREFNNEKKLILEVIFHKHRRIFLTLTPKR